MPRPASPCQLFLPLALLLLFHGASPANAQDDNTEDGAAVEPERPDVHLTLGGTLQPRFSYGRIVLDDEGGDDERERIGFGLRRARLRLGATLAGRTGAYVQLGGAGASVELLDALIFFDLTDRLRLRLGRFTPTQPHAFQPTSHKHIDAASRAAIARQWGDITLGGGRDFGVEAQYETSSTTARLGLYNGDGSWSRLRANFREDLPGDPTGGTDTRGLAAGLYGAYRPAALPGIEVGGFAGYNGSENPSTRPSADFFPFLENPSPEAPEEDASTPYDQGRSYFSYAGHLYWGAQPGSQPVRLKADFLGIRYEDLSRPPTASPQLPSALEQHALGASLLGAVRPHRTAEVLARLERFNPATGRDDDARDYLTAAASLSLSALRGRPYERQRLTLAYTTRWSRTDGENDRPHLLILQLQLVF